MLCLIFRYYQSNINDDSFQILPSPFKKKNSFMGNIIKVTPMLGISTPFREMVAG